MAKDAPAPKRPGDGINEGDYAALLATLSASERGRAFLAEYARRQHVAETEVLLAAITRVEAMIAAQRAPAAVECAPVEPAAVAPEPAKKEPLLARLRVIAQETQPIRPEVPVPASAFAPAPITATSLAEVSWYAENARPADNGVRITVADDERATAIADDEVVMAVVEDQPEVGVGDGEPATGAVEDAPAFATAPVLTIPDVPPAEAKADSAVTPPDADSAPVPLSNVLGQPAPSPADEPEQAAPSEALKQVAPSSRDEFEQPAPLMSEAAEGPTRPASDSFDQPAPSPGDPLAQLMALSDEERIALFS